MEKIGKKKALFIAQKLHVDFVYNMAKLEGNAMTFPEVKTVLEGISVGGRKISDLDQVLRISQGWKEVIEQVNNNTFAVNKKNYIKLNEIVARNEALEVGKFRSGQVRINGTEYMPPAADKLDHLFDQLMQEFNSPGKKETNKGYDLFLEAARNQFFYDGNKRTGQLMMNGYLLANGYSPISIEPSRQQEYNHKMLNYYESGQKEEMIEFLGKLQTLTFSNQSKRAIMSIDSRQEKVMNVLINRKDLTEKQKIKLFDSINYEMNRDRERE